MPRAIFILAWDTLDGAIIERIIPAGTDIGINEIQTIDVAHQFNQESDWIIIEDTSFKAVSVYNQDVGKSLVLVLGAGEIPATFTKFMVELAGFVLPRSERPDLIQRLEGAFSMVQAEIPVHDLVMMNLANRVEALEEEKLDLVERIEAVASLAADLPTKILLHLVARESVDIETLAAISNVDITRVRLVLKSLARSGYVVVDPSEQAARLVPAFDQVVISTKKRVDQQFTK